MERRAEGKLVKNCGINPQSIYRFMLKDVKTKIMKKRQFCITKNTLKK